jgi:hypothetical protein
MMPDPALQPDSAAILQHLRALTRCWDECGEPVMLEMRCLFPDRTPDVARFSPDDMGLGFAAEHAAAMNAAKLNIYVCVNPVRQKTARGSATDADVPCAFFCFADADDEAAAANILNFTGPKHTMAVITGRTPFARPHIYYELEEPCRNMTAWTDMQRAIARTLKTDPVVINPSRIMRLGGTVNWPTPDKAAKRGRVPEICTVRTQYDDDRAPLPFDRLLRVFPPVSDAAPAGDGPQRLEIDTGSFPPPLDRERMTIQALSGKDWHEAVVKLTGSYVSRGLSDGEIHSLTDPLTLTGYTVEQTRREVQTAIDGARRKGFAPAQPPDYTPNFDHAPAPTPSDPAPVAPGWVVQTAADFTADFIAPEYIIDGIIQRGRIYTLTAPTGSGKTAAMLYASVAIATGMAFCAHEVESGDVLFMAGENPDDVRARVIATLEFYGINPSNCRLHFIAGTFSIRRDMEKLRQEAERLPELKLAVIDTFAAYFDGDDENSNAQALDFARLVRKIAAFPSKPAVIMPTHPVKNARRDNLSPKGGSSLLNEVDGNLTLWNDGGILSMHWQGKFRGAEFSPLSMELQRYETDKICDNQGRIMPTILAKPILQLRASQLAKENLTLEDRLLIGIRDYPAISLEQRGSDAGGVHKEKVRRVLAKMADQKLVRRFRTNWELTRDGERAIEIIENGGGFVPEIDP